MNWEAEMDFEIAFPDGLYTVDPQTGTPEDVTEAVKSFVQSATEKATAAERNRAFATLRRKR